MVALDVVLMVVVVVALAGALAWAIVVDRRSKRASGGSISPSDAPLHRNLMMPRDLRTRRMARLPRRRGRGSRSSTT